MEKHEMLAIVDQVEEALVKQGKKSEDGNKPGKCMYRGPDGTKCGIGHLISDRCYNPLLEGTSARNTLIRDALQCSGLPTLEEHDAIFLLKLQQVHDQNGAKDWSYAFERMRRQIREGYYVTDR